MNSAEMVRVIDDELLRRGWTQYQFCQMLGINSSAMSAWRKGSMPQKSRIEQIEKLLEIKFADYEKREALEELRDDLRVLLRSAKDLPPSSVYQLVAQIEKEKEDAH